MRNKIDSAVRVRFDFQRISGAIDTALEQSC